MAYARSHDWLVWLVWLVGLVGLLRLVGLVGIVGPGGLVGPVALVGLVGRAITEVMRCFQSLSQSASTEPYVRFHAQSSNS